MRRSLAALTALLCGCAATGSGYIIPAGERPSPEQAATAVRDYLRETLKDPDSIKQFEYVKGPILVNWPLAGGFQEAWLTCVRYNAKNSYGAYVGVQLHGIAMRVEGRSIQIVPMPVPASRWC